MKLQKIFSKLRIISVILKLRNSPVIITPPEEFGNQNSDMIEMEYIDDSLTGDDLKPYDGDDIDHALYRYVSTEL